MLENALENIARIKVFRF